MKVSHAWVHLFRRYLAYAGSGDVTTCRTRQTVGLLSSDLRDEVVEVRFF